MLHLIILLTSLAHASYQYGNSVVTQQFALPYVLTKEGAFCKNHGHTMQGELAMPETLVLKTPPGGVVACAQSVMFHVQQDMCSDTFWANGNQCACLRPGVVCKEERSESGFALYSLARLGKKHHKKCAKKKTQTECENMTGCEWKEDACGGLTLSKEHYGYPVGSPQFGVNPNMAVTPQYAPNTLMAGAYGAPRAGMAPGMAPGMMGNQLVPWAHDHDCEREVDEHTGLSSIIDLPLATNVNICYRNVQANPQCNQMQFVFQQRTDGFPGECSCVRINLYCDEETRPGWLLYDFTQGPNAMGGVPPTGIQQAHGVPPPVTGAYPQTRPGAYPQTRPGAYPATGYAATGYQQPGYGAAGYGTGAAGYGTGVYPATGYQQPGMAYQPGIRLSKTHNSESSDKTVKLVLFYAVIPVASISLLAAAFYLYRRYQAKRTNFQHILMDDKSPVV